jgi:FkbM family methyltransferase
MFLGGDDDYPPMDMVADRYETATTRLLEELLRPGMVVVDVGAHVGYYSLLAARLVGPTGRVYAFEPEPSNYGLLMKNVALNGYTNIETRQAAIADRTGPVQLFVSGLDNGSHSLYRVGKPVRDTIMVHALTLDEFLASQGWPPVQVMKMDIEGGELQALRGMREFLERADTLCLCVELCPSILTAASTQPQQLLDTLLGAGFILHVLVGQALIPYEALDMALLLRRLMRTGDYVNVLAIKGRLPAASSLSLARAVLERVGGR